MKYYLVDKYDNINTTVDLGDDTGLLKARTYFLGVKKIDEKEFDKLWRVMTKEQWDLQFKVGLQNRQMDNMKYEWWKEESNQILMRDLIIRMMLSDRKKKGFTNHP